MSKQLKSGEGGENGMSHTRKRTTVTQTLLADSVQAADTPRVVKLNVLLFGFYARAVVLLDSQPRFATGVPPHVRARLDHKGWSAACCLSKSAGGQVSAIRHMTVVGKSVSSLVLHVPGWPFEGEETAGAAAGPARWPTSSCAKMLSSRCNQDECRESRHGLHRKQHVHVRAYGDA